MMTACDRKTAVIWIGLSQFVMLAVNFLLLKLMTSQFSVESFGYYSLCMTFTFFARQVLFDPISIVVAKKCGSAAHDLRGVSDEFQIVRYITDNIGLALLLLGFLSWLLAYALFNRPIEGVVAWSCFFYICANGAQGIYFNVLNSISDRKHAALFSIADAVLKLMLVSLVFWFFEKKVVYTLISISAGALAVFIGVRYYVGNYFSFGKLPQMSIRVMAKRSFMMSMPLYLPTLLVAFKSVGDRWILAAFIGVNELAAFSVLLQLGHFSMTLSVGVLQTFIAPKIYKLSADKSGTGFTELKCFLDKLLFGVFVFACIASGIAIVLSDWIFQLFVGRDYRIFAVYLPFFIISGAFAAAAGILHLVVISVFETRVVGRLMISAVLLSIASASFLIITWGFVGAVAGLVTASAVTAFLYWFALYRRAFRLALQEGSQGY